MPEVDINAIYEAMSRATDEAEDDAQSWYEAPTVESVKQSLEAVGVDTDRDKSRLDDVINILVANDEWGSETAYQTVVALEDGILTDDELYTILSKETLDDNIVLHVDGRERDSKNEEEETEEVIIETTEEEEEETSWIDSMFDAIFWSPLEGILGNVVNLIGERLERFIANALGMEREE